MGLTCTDIEVENLFTQRNIKCVGEVFYLRGQSSSSLRKESVRSRSQGSEYV